MKAIGGVTKEGIYKMKATKIAAFAVLAVSASVAQAATLQVGDNLSVSSGSATSSGSFVVGSGSFFGMDLNANSKISVAEATPITGLSGITVGQTTTPGTIDTWFFASAIGMDFLKVALTGGTSGVDMSGWTIFWGGYDIDMSSNAWQYSTTDPSINNIMARQTYTSGVGNFAWDGVYGHAYSIDYTATVPADSPLAGTQYYLHLEGCVPVLTPSPGDCGYVPIPSIPEASTYGMMLAGLGLVGVATRRRKLAKG